MYQNEPVVYQEDPLFASAHNALLFAFNFSGQQYERPMMNRMADDPVAHVSKGLSGMDGAAQAGMIMSKILKLPPLHQYIVFATYAPRLIDCSCDRPCCTGRKPNEYWHACIRMIEEAAITQALTGCISHRVLRRGIVQREFGDKNVVLSTLAERAGVSETTAISHNTKVRWWLNGRPKGKNQEAVSGVKTEAISLMEQVLINDGLVGT
ncbi:MAG: DNA-binding protein [Burkholderiaceae bacterium]|nr:DNA-binding protein [Burkholderiaceae bacterium]